MGPTALHNLSQRGICDLRSVAATPTALVGPRERCEVARLHHRPSHRRADQAADRRAAPHGAARGGGRERGSVETRRRRAAWSWWWRRRTPPAFRPLRSAGSDWACTRCCCSPRRDMCCSIGRSASPKACPSGDARRCGGCGRFSCTISGSEWTPAWM